jgi:hypothetical protein
MMLSPVLQLFFVVVKPQQKRLMSSETLPNQMASKLPFPRLIEVQQQMQKDRVDSQWVM